MKDLKNRTQISPEALSEVSNDSSEDLLSKKVRLEEEESLWNEAFSFGSIDQHVDFDDDFPPLSVANHPKSSSNVTADDSLVKEPSNPANKSAGNESS